MKNKIIVFLIIFFQFFVLADANEVILKATEIQTEEQGNIIIGIGDAEAKTQNGIEIYANKFTYNKDKKILIANGDVTVINKIKNIKIRSETIQYEEINQKITSYDLTKINLNEKYFIQTRNIQYHHLDGELFTDFLTEATDIFNNKITLQKFKYSIKDESIKGKNIEIIDNKNNKYFFEDGILKLKKNLLLGKDLTLYFNSNSFNVAEGQPRLKGNAVYKYNNKTLIEKGVFTTCKKNDKCPPWVITSKQVIHDQNKKEISYKNAWLKIYDVPVFYFPKFFHPDPSVKRRSGFLKPKFGDSKSLGASINLPYFYAISDSSDLTFKPRIFGTDEFLLQSEYRKVTKSSSHILDFSINESDADKNKGTKTHFFSKSYFVLDMPDIDESYINLEIQRTSSDNYLKLYSLDTEDSIVSEVGVLESVFEFAAMKNDFWLDLTFESYETLGKLSGDRYEFVYPNYTLNKIIDLEKSFVENLEFTSSGNQKTHSTNTHEAVQINDFLINSPLNISINGFENKLQALIKNVNSKGTNSSKYKEKTQSEILTMLIYNMSYPMQKFNEKYLESLIPKLSIRYSPNDTKNVKNNIRYLDKSNIFSLNRMGDIESIEGGSTLTLGLDYEKQNSDNNKILGFNVAGVLRDEKNNNLSTTSTLGQKQSDIVGGFYYSPINNLSFDYDFSLNNKLDTANLHDLNISLSANNFVSTFNFYEQNNKIGNNSYIGNEIKYLLDESNSFAFSTRKNKKNNLTEYYNLIYEYKNDCLVASIKYNKEYYESNNIKPFEQLFFNITLIPLGSTQTDNIIKQK